MNQILTTEKIYVTPQLKRKKKFFKFEFFVSILLLCILSIVYLYAEYDKNKSAEVGKKILTATTELKTQALNKENSAKLSKEEYNVWTFVLEQTDDKQEITQAIIPEAPVEIEEKHPITTEVYYDSNDEPYTVIALLYIPKLDKEFAILSRTSDELLKINPTRFEGYEKGPEPNEVGNLCIVGHNYLDDRFFSQVPTLELGDTIELTDIFGDKIIYSMYDKYQVDPTDISCLSQNTNGKKEVTLITCNNDGSERVITKYREQK